MGVTVSVGSVEQQQTRDERARVWGLPRRQSSMIHQTWLPNAPAFNTNGVATAVGAVDARGIRRRANPLHRILPWTPVDAPGNPLKPIRNQQVGGSSPPVGSNDSRHLRVSLTKPELAGKHMGSSGSGFVSSEQHAAVSGHRLSQVHPRAARALPALMALATYSPVAPSLQREAAG